jgi:hypothetical protein
MKTPRHQLALQLTEKSADVIFRRNKNTQPTLSHHKKILAVRGLVTITKRKMDAHSISAKCVPEFRDMVASIKMCLRNRRE